MRTSWAHGILTPTVPGTLHFTVPFAGSPPTFLCSLSGTVSPSRVSTPEMERWTVPVPGKLKEQQEKVATWTEGAWRWRMKGWWPPGSSRKSACSADEHTKQGKVRGESPGFAAWPHSWVTYPKEHVSAVGPGITKEPLTT